MSDANAIRTFQCPHCSTGIQIPANLPPTTAPCPKCGQKVTSPALPSPQAPTSSPRQSAPSTTSTQEQAQPAEAVAPSTEEAAIEEKRKLRLFPIFASLVAVLLLGAAALKILRSPNRGEAKTSDSSSPKFTPEERRDNIYRAKDWIVDAEATLQKFFEAKTVEERAVLTIRGKQNEAEMAAIYNDFQEDAHRTPMSVFSPVQLNDQDTKRGLFLMTYNRPEQFAITNFFRPIPPIRVKYGLEEPGPFLMSEAAVQNFVDKSLRVMAFFKKTPAGMKLDWQTYAQTKYRLLDRFVNHPEPGQKGVFRVFVQEDVDLEQRDTPGKSVFRFTDPANPQDYAKVLVQDDSELGRALSPLKWRQRIVARAPIKNATVSLKWSDSEEPVLQMGELICWEFLGLGGERGNWKSEAGNKSESQ